MISLTLSGLISISQNTLHFYNLIHLSSIPGRDSNTGTKTSSPWNFLCSITSVKKMHSVFWKQSSVH
jgi:hypothetical protein